jgi:DNA-binding response OmpR family regulator
MNGKRILLVEDNERIMISNMTALQYLGAKVEAAFTLAQARSLFAQKTFNAAVLDIMLPDGSGLDLLQEVRAVS